ncbi:MAG: Gfo/Idh/MocA family oxidoreductase [Bacteroidales bacterium]|jgi:predicted dehydrogenase
MNIALIGYGYWGPNLARNINQHPVMDLYYICDNNENRISEAKKLYPHTLLTHNTDDIINDENVHCVVIATNPSQHYKLAKQSLLSGKHVLVEKPMALSFKETDELINIAVSNKLIIFSDFTFLYNGAIKKIDKIIKSGDLGRILYIDATRINLGIFQNDVNVLGDLATHDLSVILSFIEEKPVAVSAVGRCHIKKDIENLAYLTLFYNSDLIVHIHCSWSAPVKIRQMIIGGDKKMLIYNDIEPSEKIKVYDSGITFNYEEKESILIDYRRGDVFVPKYDTTEPLKIMIDKFANCVIKNQQDIKNIQISLKIAQILDKAKLSLQNQGKTILL